MKPFCDFLGVTVPAEHWDSLRLDIAEDLDAVGMGVQVDEDRSVLWRSADSNGTVKATKVGRVWALGCSGAACAGLRAFDRFNSLLAAIGTRPHRVTRLDASVDVQEDAAPIVAEITRAGRAGELSLTRKSIKPSDVTSFTGVRVDGAVTGTVYVGQRRADARMVVYDKRHERIERNLPDVGNLTRYELRLKSRTGVTLRDASDPAGVFWHYASPEFLPLPSGAPAWAPEGSGFPLERMLPVLPAARLKRRVEDSVEVAALIDLALACGPYGVSLLCSLIRDRAGVQGVTPAESLSEPQRLGLTDAAEVLASLEVTSATC